MRRSTATWTVVLAAGIATLLVYRTVIDTSDDASLPAVAAPATDEEQAPLDAVAITPANPLFARARSEVRIRGTVAGRSVDAVVYRSQQQADSLRIGWTDRRDLVIREPQYSEDAGRPAGYGDSNFVCGGGRTGISVVCETYTVTPR